MFRTCPNFHQDCQYFYEDPTCPGLELHRVTWGYMGIVPKRIKTETIIHGKNGGLNSDMHAVGIIVRFGVR